MKILYILGCLIFTILTLGFVSVYVHFTDGSEFNHKGWIDRILEYSDVRKNKNKKTMNFVEWLNKNWDKDNFCPPELEAQEALYIVKDYLLGEDWYSSALGNTKQINTDIVAAILKQYSKRFRKEAKNGESK